MLDGYVYAVGGWEGSSRLDSVEKYDPETNVWTPVASLKMAVTSPAVVAHEGRFLCIHNDYVGHHAAQHSIHGHGIHTVTISKSLFKCSENFSIVKLQV